MKKFVALMLVALFSVSVVACAPMGTKPYSRVKCPACGHEFEAPAK